MSVKDRQTGIGGTDAAAILGMSPWKTPLQVYLEKIGEAKPLEPSDAMKWGNLLEEPISAEYERETGRKVRKVEEKLVHKDHPFIVGHIDRAVDAVDGEPKRILEVKTSARREGWGDSGTDDVPDQYLVQVQHYMAITGAEIADIAALIGGNDLRIYHVKRDDKLIEVLLQKEVNFWKVHVEPRVPPDPITSADCNTRWLGGSGTVVASAVDIERVNRLVEIRDAVANMSKEVEELQLALKTTLGPNDTLVLPDGKKIATCKTQKRKAYSVAEGTFRVFRLVS